jgi:hypothetical protein
MSFIDWCWYTFLALKDKMERPEWQEDLSSMERLEHVKNIIHVLGCCTVGLGSVMITVSYDEQKENGEY